MYILEAEGKNKAETEAEALRLLGAQASDVTFEPVSGASGILGLVSRKPVVIRAFPHKDTPRDVLIRGIVQTLIQRMGLEASVLDVRETEDNIVVELESKDTGMLIGKHGRTLDALQFLVNLLMNSKRREYARIMLDVESYREKRQNSLTRLAKSVAARVDKSGQSVALDYMNPYERRIVHLALEDDERVFTKSDGNGVYKRVRVLPAAQSGDAEPEFDEDSFGNEKHRHAPREDHD